MNGHTKQGFTEEFREKYIEEDIDIFTEEGANIFMEKYIDKFNEEYTAIFLDDLAKGFLEKPLIHKDLMIPNEECAKKYARLLYDEDCDDWERNLDIWVHYYDKYGLWAAKLKYPPIMLDGLSIIIFQAKDGKVVYYE
jgi:hypothetical protein